MNENVTLVITIDAPSRDRHVRVRRDGVDAYLRWVRDAEGWTVHAWRLEEGE